MFNMKRSLHSRCLISYFILSIFMFEKISACWGDDDAFDAEMTKDFNISVGSVLEIHCRLNSFLTPIGIMINSSHLVITKGKKVLSQFTRVVDDYTIQLKIPNATAIDTGRYYCKISDDSSIVCATTVFVDYPPTPVENLSCINRNFESLNCTWDTGKNNSAIYTIQTYLMNDPSLPLPCPSTTVQRNSCQWSTETNPKFIPFTRKLFLTVTGKSSFGIIMQNFTKDLYSIVIPNSPENLEITDILQQSAFVSWKSPIKNIRNFPLKYQIRVHLQESSTFKDYHVEHATSFKLINLIPHLNYTVSIRCRSHYAESENMWSNFTSLMFETLADVPYQPPDFIPEAFELHVYERSRSATLYWKALPKLHYNGKAFHYHIKYYKNDHSSAAELQHLNSSRPFINIENLEKNASYTFHLHSANEKGVSKDYKTIFIDSQVKTPPSPRDVKVILQDDGTYDLTWNPPNRVGTFRYVVLWCFSMKPYHTRCDDSIDWINGSLSNTNITLNNLTDVKADVHFAVVSKSGTGSSGMEWASCTASHANGLNRIKYVKVEQKNPTDLKIIWSMDCLAALSVTKYFKVTYCGMERDTNCRFIDADRNVSEIVLKKLKPYTNYKIRVQLDDYMNDGSTTFNVSEEVYQSTMLEAPGPPQNVVVSSNSSDSFFVGWNPPENAAEYTMEYIVSYNESSRRVCGVIPEARSGYMIKIDGLKAYSTYVVQVQACIRTPFNLHPECSEKSQEQVVRTDIAEPGYMKPPQIQKVNTTHIKIVWSEPIFPNGPIDFYSIKWHEEKQHSSDVPENILQLSKVNSMVLDMRCSPATYEGKNYLFYAQAVNRRADRKNNNEYLYGKFSEATQVQVCQLPEDWGAFIAITAVSLFGLFCLILATYQLAVGFKKKIQKIKGFVPILPKGLDGSAENPSFPSNNLEDKKFKELQLKDTENLPQKTDEIKLNTKANLKLGGRFKEDSIDCSSVLSTNTHKINRSSENDPKLEFSYPRRSNTAITEQEQPSSEKKLLQGMDPVMLSNELENSVDDVISKNQIIYSKSDCVKNSDKCLLFRVNALVLCDNSLANSEPSLFTQKKKKNKTIKPSYSKLTVAKSNYHESLANVKQNGYCNLSMAKKDITSSPTHLQSSTSLMSKTSGIKECPTSDKSADDKQYNVNRKKTVAPCRETTENIQNNLRNCGTHLNASGYVLVNDARILMT